MNKIYVALLIVLSLGIIVTLITIIYKNYKKRINNIEESLKSYKNTFNSIFHIFDAPDGFSYKKILASLEELKSEYNVFNNLIQEIRNDKDGLIESFNSIESRLKKIVECEYCKLLSNTDLMEKIRITKIRKWDGYSPVYQDATEESFEYYCAEHKKPYNSVLIYEKEDGTLTAEYKMEYVEKTINIEENETRNL